MMPICYNDSAKGEDMEKMLETEAKPGAGKNQKIDYKAEIADLLAQMHVIDDHIRRTQAETAQIRAETRVMLEDIKAELNVS